MLEQKAESTFFSVSFLILEKCAKGKLNIITLNKNISGLGDLGQHCQVCQ